MIKLLTILKKKAPLTQDEFLRYWKEKHGPLAAKLIPGLRKYIQCHPIKVSEVESNIDGIAELWWDNLKSIQDYQTWRQASNEAKVLIEDEDKFLDKSQFIRFFTEEKVIVEGESLRIKSFHIMKKKASLTQDEYLRYWKEKHGPLVANLIPGLRKYIQCHPIKVPGVESNIDGIAELWWDNLKSFQNFPTWRQSNEAKVMIEDEDKFMDKSQTLRFLAEEKVIIKG